MASRSCRFFLTTMTDAEIVADLSDTALAGIVRQLSASRGWPERLQAAKAEQSKRRLHELQQDKESHL